MASELPFLREYSPSLELVRGQIGESNQLTTGSFPSDWERVIVVWSKTDDSWAPSQLLLSQHSGYGRKEWSEIQNTFDTADAGLARGGDNGRQNLDHPKVYVAWGKHAAYDDRNTGWNGVIAQMTDNAFRSQDWWYFPKKSKSRIPGPCPMERRDGADVRIPLRSQAIISERTDRRRLAGCCRAMTGDMRPAIPPACMMACATLEALLCTECCARGRSLAWVTAERRWEDLSLAGRRMVVRVVSAARCQ